MRVALGALLLVLVGGCAPPGPAAPPPRPEVGITQTGLTVAGDGIAGRLYVPGSVSGPPLVVLGGSEGGTPDRFARLFAEAGHVTLALAYFGERGLPDELNRVPLEYLSRGLGWLRDRPETSGEAPMLWGASRGGEAALLVASYFPELVSGTVAASPADVVVCSFPPSKHSAWTLDGRELPCTRRRNLGREPIPVEQITTPVLLICGERDRVWAACTMSRRVASRLVVPHQLLVYPESGHFAAFEDEALEKTLDFLAAPSG